MNKTCEARWGTSTLQGPVQEYGARICISRRVNHTVWNDTLLTNATENVKTHIDAMQSGYNPDTTPVSSIMAETARQNDKQERIEHLAAVKHIEYTSWWTSITGISVSTVAVILLAIALLFLLCQFCKAISK